MKLTGGGRSIAGAVLLAAACALACLSAVTSGKAPARMELTSAGRSAAVQPIRLPETGVDVNTAPIETLTGLPGIGEKLAQAIVTEREAHGPFYYPEDLLTVRGIGPKKLAELQSSLFLTTPND